MARTLGGRLMRMHANSPFGGWQTWADLGKMPGGAKYLEWCPFSYSMLCVPIGWSRYDFGSDLVGSLPWEMSKLIGKNDNGISS